MRLKSMISVVVGGSVLTGLVACGAPGVDDEHSSSITSTAGGSTSASQPTMSSTVVSAHMVELVDTSDSQVWADYGSYAVVVRVLAEKEVGGTLKGVSASPLDVPSSRDLQLKVESVAWTHDKALVPLQAGQTVSVRTYDGWLGTGDSRVAVVNEGVVRPEIGGRYLVVLAEGSQDSPDNLAALPGSIAAVQDGQLLRQDGSAHALADVDEVVKQLGSKTPNPAATPRAGEGLQERIMRVQDQG